MIGDSTIYKWVHENGFRVARVYQKTPSITLHRHTEFIRQAKQILGSWYAGAIHKRKI